MAVPNEELSTADVAEAALEQLASLTGKEVVGLTAFEPTDDGWSVEVEVVEDHRTPSSADILAVYEAQLDDVGDLVSYHRTRRYGRGGTGGRDG